MKALLASWLLGWPSGAVRAAVAMKGWEWFVVDTFGAPALGFLEAWGLFLLVSFAVLHHPGATTPDKPAAAVVVEAFLFSLLMSGVFFVSLLALVSLR